MHLSSPRFSVLEWTDGRRCWLRQGLRADPVCIVAGSGEPLTARLLRGPRPAAVRLGYRSRESHEGSAAGTRLKEST
jgi:hypothetical protein